MRASASLSVDQIDGAAYARDVRSEPPFAIRRTGDRFLVVGTAAAPVGGDILELSVEVAPGTTAKIGTVAATIVWPGPDPSLVAQSRLTTTIRVGAGAHLIWRPEPIVSVAGSHHLAQTVVELADQATCEIIEEYSLGRAGEACGRLLTDLRIVRNGKTLIRHGECFKPAEGASTLAGLAFARHVLAGVFVGVNAGDSNVEVSDPAKPRGLAGAWLPVAADAALLLVAGPDRPTVLESSARLRN